MSRGLPSVPLSLSHVARVTEGNVPREMHAHENDPLSRSVNHVAVFENQSFEACVQTVQTPKVLRTDQQDECVPV